MRNTIVYAALIILAAALTCWSADWHQWRGPEQTGVSREKNLPESWSPDGQNVLWQNKVGGMSSPIVMNGRVYTLTRTGEQPAADTLIAGPRTQEALVCIDANDGRILWEYRENLTQTEVPFHRLGWSNVVGDPQTGRVYALMAHCSLICLDGNTGKLLWRRQLTEDFGMISTFGGRTPSPMIDEDQVILGGVAFGWGDNARSQHRVFAFDKNTGQLRWSNGTGGIPVDSPYNTPVAAVIGGQRLVILGAGDGGVHAFKSRTGEKVWSHPVSKRGLNASVVVDGTRVYACHSEENIANSVLGSVVCIEAADGKPRELWRADGLEAGFSSPTIINGRLYVADNKATVFCLDALTGKQQWKKTAGVIGKASLVYGDGKLYVADGTGRFTILKPGDKKADVLSKVEIPETGVHVQFGREFGIFGSPAIANGRMYLQTVNTMYCIGRKGEGEAPAEPRQVTSDPIPEPAKEDPIDPANPPKPAYIQVRPADAVLRPGEKLAFTAWAFDSKGRSLGQLKPETWSLGQLNAPLPPTAPPGTIPAKIGNLKGDLDNAGNFTAAPGPHQGGAIVATAVGITGQARVRVLPPLPWKFDFEQNPIDKPPLTWLGAGGKFAVRDDAGNKTLVKLTDMDLYARARTNFGAEDMSNYTIQADIKVGEKVINDQRNTPDAGIINQRYVLVLLGNHQRLQIHVWSATLPYSLNRTISYSWQPNTWYTLKLRVDQSADKAIIQGKVWPTGQPEPQTWNIELEDTLPNRNGNPGLYGNSLVTPQKSEIYYDNVIVTENQK